MSAPPISSWPERLRRLRERLRLNYQQAGDRVGVSKQTWWDWEKGHWEPSRSRRMLIVLLEQGKLPREVSE